MDELAGKTALVTGAGTGMGRAIALALAGEGCRVAAVGRRRDKLEETARLASAGSRIVPFSADVGVAIEAQRVVREIEAALGPVEILVNNAGVNVRKRALADLSVEDWEYMIRVNLSGPFYLLHAVLKGMRTRQRGLVVNISSIAGVRPSPLGGAGYCASKFGLNALSGVLSQEEAARGIRSTVICPGEVDTPLLDERPEPVPPERRASMLQPQDVAAAVLFVVRLPPRAHVPELILKPAVQPFA